MGQQQSSTNPTFNHNVQKDCVNLRRQRSMFFPLGENRRLKLINYLLIASDGIASSAVQDKEFHEKKKKLTATSTNNLILMEEAINEYDYNNKNGKQHKINLKMEKDSYDTYLDDLFTNTEANGFMIYFTGQLTEKQQLVLTNRNDGVVLYDFNKIIKRWRCVPNYESKHLLIIVDAENSGSILGLAKKPTLTENEDFFGIEEEGESNTNFSFKRDPTFSIFASQTLRKKDTSFYLVGESPNNNFQGDFKVNNRIENSGKGPSNFDDAQKNHQVIENGQMQSFIKSSNFTAIFSQYMKSTSHQMLKDVAKAKGIATEVNDNDPFFFGFQVKAYLDFGIFFWARYQKMINQLELNGFIAQGLAITSGSQVNSLSMKISKHQPQLNDHKLNSTLNNLENSSNPSSFNEIEEKLVQQCSKGDYFGFVGKNLKDKKFGNPLFSKPAHSNKSSGLIKSSDNLEVPQYSSNQISSLTNMDVNSLYSNNVFKSTILRGQQNLDDGSVVRKHYGMQEYKEENEIVFHELYEGMWMDDKFSHYGTYYYKNGDRYEGEYKSGKKNGFGIYYYSNGNIYAGSFEDNQIQGIGKLVYPDGQIFIGNFKSNQREGFGILRQVLDGVELIQQGIWLNNQQNGKAKITLGQFKTIYMEANFFEGAIKGEVKYNVIVPQSQTDNILKTDPKLEDSQRERKMKIVFAANWINSRRVQDINLFEESSLIQKDATQFKSLYLPLVKQFEQAYNKFIPPTVKIA